MNVQKFLARHPKCCFCGGEIQATTVDHQPATIIFPNRQRPDGMTFPACASCNKKSSKYEVIIAFLARMAGSSQNIYAADLKEFNKLVYQIHFNFPGLHSKMVGQPTLYKRNGVLLRGGTLNLRHQEIQLAANEIAAKLNVAMFYRVTGMPAKAGYLIATKWMTSQDQSSQFWIRKALDMLPNDVVLVAGKKNTEKNFFIRYHHSDGVLWTVAVFYQSIALIAKGVEAGIAMQFVDSDHLFSVSDEHGIGLFKQPHF